MIDHRYEQRLHRSESTAAADPCLGTHFVGHALHRIEIERRSGDRLLQVVRSGCDKTRLRIALSGDLGERDAKRSLRVFGTQPGIECVVDGTPQEAADRVDRRPENGE